MPRPDSTILDRLAAAEHPTPFDFLGIHSLRSPAEPGRVVRAFLPWAERAWVRCGQGRFPMERIHSAGIFEAIFSDRSDFFAYRLEAEKPEGGHVELEDPYRLGPVLDEDRLVGFNRGEEIRSHQVLGAHLLEHEGLAGCCFAVWAPSARAVSVIAAFNGWDARCHPMRPRGTSGVWELFVPGVVTGDLYKFSILGSGSPIRLEKTDPQGRAMELRPRTASVVCNESRFDWTDDSWMQQRGARQALHAPLAIYEVHLGSWRRRHGPPYHADDPGWLSYRELAEQLLPYVAQLGFTHVELMPVTEHPFDGSWGYQTLGYFAATSRYGSPDDFRYFVERAHRLGLGVILDWVPAHFPRDPHGLARFDGSALYEHADPRQGEHPDWGTLVYNYGRNEVVSFLLSSALYWVEEFHVDGLRVDAVASMLYLDYSREEGQWIPNRYGGRENLEAISFLQRLNIVLHGEHSDVLCFAEESTAWPQVTQPVYTGGLGFDLKWNMGWMNDTLDYMHHDPLFRRHLHDRLTFSLVYAFSEQFLLPLSHDEVVHQKGSLIAKMPGYDPDKFANLRALYAWMYLHPGKKLLFMGAELAQWGEWDHAAQLEWHLLDYPPHRGVNELVKELNRLYREQRALHEVDFSPDGFEWIDCHDADHSVLSFVRFSLDWEECVVAVINFTPMRWEAHRLAVPFAGPYRLLLNSSDPRFGGAVNLPPEGYQSVEETWQGRPAYLELDLPPLSALVLRFVGPVPRR